MNNNTYNTQLTGQLNDAVLQGYIRPIEINQDWMAFRNPNYDLNSASLHEGRFNTSGKSAYYLASGDYCGKLEVPKYSECILCRIKPHTVYVFDIPAFAVTHNYNDAFVKQRTDGGWEVCQAVSQYLTDNHQVSGFLYQSAAMHNIGETGYCIAVLPGRDQQLEADFFVRQDTAPDGTVNNTQDSPSLDSQH